MKLIANALPPEALAKLRSLVADAPFTNYWIADRGKYQFNDSIRAPELFAALSSIVPSSAILQSRITRHKHGDYAQPKDDDRFWAGRRAIELTLDFSAAGSDEAQVVWFDAARSLVLPQTPGTAAVVERFAPLVRYERYLTHRIGDAEVLRLRLILSAEMPAT